MKNVARFSIAVAALFFCSHSYASDDADVIEYLQITREIPELIRATPPMRGILAAEDFVKLTEKYLSSLERPNSADHLIVFREEPIHHNGVPRPAVLNGGKGEIHRGFWRALSKSQKRALVLLRGLSDLRISWGRLSATESSLALELDDIESLSRLIRLSSANTSFKNICDHVVTMKNGEPSFSTHTIHFMFFWNVGGRDLRLVYLENTNEFRSEDMAYLTLADISRERLDLGTVTNYNTHTLYPGVRRVETKVNSGSFITIKNADGSEEDWTWSGGQKTDFRGKVESTKPANYRGNSIINSTRVDREEATVDSSCAETPVSNDWKAVVGDAFLNADVSNFDDFIDRVKVAEISYELCLNERGAANCVAAKGIADGLAAQIDSKWKILKDAIDAKVASEVRRRRLPNPEVRRRWHVTTPSPRVRVNLPPPPWSPPQAERRALDILNETIRDYDRRDMITEIRRLREEVESRRHP